MKAQLLGNLRKDMLILKTCLKSGVMAWSRAIQGEAEVGLQLFVWKII